MFGGASMVIPFAIEVLASATILLALATVALVTITAVATRTAIRQFGRQLLPVLIPSRLQGAKRKVLFNDNVWLELFGDQTYVSCADRLYFAIPLRNIGTGIAVIQGFSVANVTSPEERTPPQPPEPTYFIDSKTDLLLSPGDVTHLGFSWPIPAEHPGVESLLDTLNNEEDRGFNSDAHLDILHCDHIYGQYTVTRLALSRVSPLAEFAQASEQAPEAAYFARALKHWPISRRMQWLPGSPKSGWQRIVQSHASAAGPRLLRLPWHRQPASGD